MHLKKKYSVLERAGLSGVIWHPYMLLASPYNNKLLVFHSLKLVFEKITVQNGNVRPVTSHS